MLLKDFKHLKNVINLDKGGLISNIRTLHTLKKSNMKEIYIIAAVRTPLGSFGGSLKQFTATQLGAVAIKGAIAKAGVAPELVNDVLMGSVLQANLGQAPARQAAKFAGLPNEVNCTTINKVCASGMKAIAQAAQSILLGVADFVVAG